LPELAFCLLAGGDNAGIGNYVKLRSAVTCGLPLLKLNVQLAVRLCTRILHSYAPGSGAVNAGWRAGWPSGAASAGVTLAAHPDRRSCQRWPGPALGAIRIV
jgi:hypothetical protein